MKPFTILIAFALAACSSLMNPSGAVQPVVIKDAKQQIMFTTCSGSVEDWASCNNKAGKACVNGYDVMEKEESAVGGKRELTFKCK